LTLTDVANSAGGCKLMNKFVITETEACFFLTTRSSPRR
jgi:hypothetical protein